VSLYFHIGLEEALKGAVCRRCNIGRLKADDIIDGCPSRKLDPHLEINMN
jgi:hypothetical protein